MWGVEREFFRKPIGSKGGRRKNEEELSKNECVLGSSVPDPQEKARAHRGHSRVTSP